MTPPQQAPSLPTAFLARTGSSSTTPSRSCAGSRLSFTVILPYPKHDKQAMIYVGNYEIDIQCPRCDFYTSIFIKQARLRDVVICRGCKNNIQLEDHMNQVRKAERDIKRQSDQLFDSMDDITINISL
jgi:hypothetical protein